MLGLPQRDLRWSARTVEHWFVRTPRGGRARSNGALPDRRSTSRAHQLEAGADLFPMLWGVDIFECTRCGGKLTILAFIEKSSAVKEILDHLDLPSAPLPLGKARGPPQVARGF